MDTTVDTAVARNKQTIMQRAFTYMEMREDFLEGDDLDVRNASLKSALNMRALATRAIEARPGLRMEKKLVGGLSEVQDLIELRPGNSLVFGLMLIDGRITVIDANFNEVIEQFNMPWGDAEFWTYTRRNKVYFGNANDGIFVLEYVDDTWVFSPFEFGTAPGGESAQPYWSFIGDATLLPSALSGTGITLTASKPLFRPGYVGTRFRYGMREIKITSFVTEYEVIGDVINELPPSFDITVENATGYRIGEAVIAADTNYQGLIVDINGNVLSVVTTSFFEGPDNNEELAGPSGSSKISSHTLISPLASPIWDEQLMSPRRGYPRKAAGAGGRLVFLDFPQVPDVIALSSTRAPEDFSVGAADDDAIVRQVGDDSPRWLHCVSLGDLILFSENGIYNVPTRENGAITPANFNPVFVDDAAALETIDPVKVEDGVIFVDSSGESVSGVFLDGNIYLKWSVRKLTTFHNHLIKSPVSLCGPALSSKQPENYVFVINGDGTLAAVSWLESMRDENVGFSPWTTEGTFINVSPFNGRYCAIVDRADRDGQSRYIECFDNTCVLDGSVFLTADEVVAGATLPWGGVDATAYSEGWDAGDFRVNYQYVLRNPETFPTGSDIYEVGLNYEARVQPWPAEQIDSGRAGTFKARVMELIVSVQNTLAFDVFCNGRPKSVGAYSFGDDTDMPPPLKTQVYRFSVFGNRDHPEMEIIKSRPGPFRILAIGQKVQA